jgi:hypothetical protein
LEGSARPQKLKDVGDTKGQAANYTSRRNGP